MPYWGVGSDKLRQWFGIGNGMVDRQLVCCPYIRVTNEFIKQNGIQRRCEGNDKSR